MKILYSIWDKGQGAFSRKEREGPRGFLPPWGRQSQVLQKWPGRVAQAQAACPAGLRGNSGTPPPGGITGGQRHGRGQAPVPV